MLEGDYDRSGTLVFKAESLDADEAVKALTIAGQRYVLKTETHAGQVEFSLYRDDNADGTWTEVLEGHLLGTTADVVSLVGTTPLLAQSAGLVG